MKGYRELCTRNNVLHKCFIQKMLPLLEKTPNSFKDCICILSVSTLSFRRTNHNKYIFSNSRFGYTFSIQPAGLVRILLLHRYYGGDPRVLGRY